MRGECAKESGVSVRFPPANILEERRELGREMLWGRGPSSTLSVDLLRKLVGVDLGNGLETCVGVMGDVERGIWSKSRPDIQVAGSKYSVGSARQARLFIKLAVRLGSRYLTLRSVA